MNISKPASEQTLPSPQQKEQQYSKPPYFNFHSNLTENHIPPLRGTVSDPSQSQSSINMIKSSNANYINSNPNSISNATCSMIYSPDLTNRNIEAPPQIPTTSSLPTPISSTFTMNRPQSAINSNIISQPDTVIQIQQQLQLEPYQPSQQYQQNQYPPQNENILQVPGQRQKEFPFRLDSPSISNTPATIVNRSNSFPISDLNISSLMRSPPSALLEACKQTSTENGLNKGMPDFLELTPSSSQETSKMAFQPKNTKRTETNNAAITNQDTSFFEDVPLQSVSPNLVPSKRHGGPIPQILNHITYSVECSSYSVLKQQQGETSPAALQYSSDFQPNQQQQSEVSYLALQQCRQPSHESRSSQESQIENNSKNEDNLNSQEQQKKEKIAPRQLQKHLTFSSLPQSPKPNTTISSPFYESQVSNIKPSSQQRQFEKQANLNTLKGKRMNTAEFMSSLSDDLSVNPPNISYGEGEAFNTIIEEDQNNTPLASPFSQAFNATARMLYAESFSQLQTKDFRKKPTIEDKNFDTNEDQIEQTLNASSIHSHAPSSSPSTLVLDKEYKPTNQLNQINASEQTQQQALQQHNYNEFGRKSSLLSIDNILQQQQQWNELHASVVRSTAIHTELFEKMSNENQQIINKLQESDARNQQLQANFNALQLSFGDIQNNLVSKCVQAVSQLINKNEPHQINLQSQKDDSAGGSIVSMQPCTEQKNPYEQVLPHQLQQSLQMNIEQLEKTLQAERKKFQEERNTFLAKNISLNEEKKRLESENINLSQQKTNVYEACARLSSEKQDLIEDVRLHKEARSLEQQKSHFEKMELQGIVRSLQIEIETLKSKMNLPQTITQKPFKSLVESQSGAILAATSSVMERSEENRSNSSKSRLVQSASQSSPKYLKSRKSPLMQNQQQQLQNNFQQQLQSQNSQHHQQFSWSTTSTQSQNKNKQQRTRSSDRNPQVSSGIRSYYYENMRSAQYQYQVAKPVITAGFGDIPTDSQSIIYSNDRSFKQDQPQHLKTISLSFISQTKHIPKQNEVNLKGQDNSLINSSNSKHNSKDSKRRA